MDCKKYDEKFYILPDEIADKENSCLIRIMEELILAGKFCLDFGCGTGYWIYALNRLRTKCTGVDISKKAIITCSNKFPNMRFSLLAGTEIPYPDYYFDFILCAWVFQEITKENDFIAVLNELRRVLKTKGKILVVDNEYPDKRVLYQSGKYGDLFFDNEGSGKLRFFQKSTVTKIMEELNLQIIKRQFIGNSFFEVYEK